MRMLSGNADPLNWAKSPSPAHEKGGFKGSAWENAIIQAAKTEQRFLDILRKHVESGVIRSERALAVLNPESANA